MGYRIAVVGATGNVGREMMNILEEVNFPVEKIHAIASRKSIGVEVSFGAQILKCEDIEQFDFSKVDIVLMSALAKQPANRYPTWAEFALELAKIGRLSRFEQSILASSKFDFLRAMPMLKAFSDPEIWELVNCTNWTRIPARSTIVTENQPGQSLFFLAQGEVKVTNPKMRFKFCVSFPSSTSKVA
jgi:hypothetical protein